MDLDVRVLANNYLFFSNAKSLHSGWYTFTASNIYGTISHSVYVDVVAGMSVALFYNLHVFSTWLNFTLCTHNLIFSFVLVSMGNILINL